jgi:hypothetical protein
MSKSVICLVPDRQCAENVLVDLVAAGFTPDDISALFPDRSGTRDFAHEKHTKAPEGAATGAGAGGALGGTLGLLAGIGTLAIPGLGPFLAAGPIMAALSGAAVGAAVGGLTGALIGMGIPEFEAKQYESKLKAGSILISVHVENDEETKRAKEALERHSAESIAVGSDASVPKAPLPSTQSPTTKRSV